MKTSKQWIDYFKENSQRNRIDWNLQPTITAEEIKTVLKSLQAWQLGETSDGHNLINASRLYAAKVDDALYVEAVKLFIKEEQKHGNNLGRYLDLIGEKRIKKDWGDSLFRKVRYFNTSMEAWTLAVITVESAAQVFYQSLKNATDCTLLKQICTDILIDEAPHIVFQQERFAMIFELKTSFNKVISWHFYKYFFIATTLVVWVAHRRLFKAGNNNFRQYYKKMMMKFYKTIGSLKPEIVKPKHQYNYKTSF
ncbi:ferritin-like domain-containing protein [Ferruginibacter albus]|uniref:ferritin-like domain-containing protein n=1 Tax=Ferruginibacter albus TaxID=2875540 RepID=UPI001CC5B929|nr:ferritin-like domain-containing protein [Ferruginibacter albus]UAY51676.1 ferritin-like domain-containing protein [Ferruginibacter albus]